MSQLFLHRLTWFCRRRQRQMTKDVASFFATEFDESRRRDEIEDEWWAFAEDVQEVITTKENS